MKFRKSSYLALVVASSVLAALLLIVWLQEPARMPAAVSDRKTPVAEPNQPGQPPSAPRFIRGSKSKVAEFDKRERTQGDRAGTPAMQGALARLNQEAPGVKVDFDSLSGAPSQIQAVERFLTKPKPGTAAAQVVADYLAAHTALFGHGADALAKARVTREDVTAHNGMTTLVWQQQLDGIPVFESLFKASVTKEGELINVGSHFLGAPEQAAGLAENERAELIASPPVDVLAAVTAAASAVGDQVEPRAAAAPEGAERKQRIEAAGLSDTQGSLAWLPMSADSLRLTWDVTLMSLKRNEMFRVLIDAKTGEPLLLRSLTNDISDATYRVFANGTDLKPLDSPKPFSPGHNTPLSTQPAEAPRTLIATPALSATASPNGWINDGGMETIGNNVDAHTDLDANNSPDLPRPSGGAGRVFDFSLDLMQAPSTYREAAVTQLFYYCNWVHDRLYQLGFTETSGNFQADNFGKGGLGNDAVQADAQDGSGTNNANFSTPSDGSPGRMQMFVFTGPAPDIDGDFDGEIVIHEYVHGLSNRLVGGGVGMSALQSRGMGEGWSDFYGLAMLSEPGDNIHGCYAAGGYATYQFFGLAENYYYGIRRYPYSTDLLKNPLTFKDIDPTQASAHSGVPSSSIFGAPNGNPSEVHNQGEVWCAALWEMRANLITKHGYAVGNERTLQLITDGMKLSVSNPNFLQARDAILQADLVNNAGADRSEVWAAFAKRGMGASAYSPASSTTTGVIEAFDMPGDLGVSPTNPFVASVTALGTFVPTSTSYTLTNNGSVPLSWTAAKTQPWCSISATGGTLAPGANVVLTWSLEPTVTGLAPGSYADTLTITDTTHSVTITRALSLTVNPNLTRVLTFPLDADPRWTRGGQWAFGTPTGQGGSAGGGYGSADPASGFSGTKVFGINLAGNYSTAVTSPEYVITQPLNLTGLSFATLRFKRWLNADLRPYSTQTTMKR